MHHIGIQLLGKYKSDSFLYKSGKFHFRKLSVLKNGVVQINRGWQEGEGCNSQSRDNRRGNCKR